MLTLDDMNPNPDDEGGAAAFSPFSKPPSALLLLLLLPFSPSPTPPEVGDDKNEKEDDDEIGFVFVSFKKSNPAKGSVASEAAGDGASQFVSLVI